MVGNDYAISGVEETKRLESKDVTKRLAISERERAAAEEKRQETEDRRQEAEDRRQDREERMQRRSNCRLFLEVS